jgi:peptide/nickel transport system substrate-binding protein
VVVENGREFTKVTRRHKRVWLLGVCALAAGVSLFAAGCGGGGSKSSNASSTSSSGSGGTASQNAGHTFATFRVTWDAPDYFDPGLSYTVTGWQIMQHEYLGLVGYKWTAGPGGATIVPALAQSLPTISADGKDYKFTLRPGLKYSNGQPVKASDFKASIERLFKVDSPGVGFYTGIVGADTFSKTKKGGISGIITNDANRTVEIKLSSPRGDFLDILGIPFAALLPASTPDKDQSTKGLPATGPYMQQSYKPSRSFVLVRNPNFKPLPGIPKGNPDKLVGTILSGDSAALQTVLSGKSDYDFRTLPTDRLPEVEQKYKDQLKLYTPASTYYFAMNMRTPPFNNIKARQAVEYAINRPKIVSLFGGLGVPTQNFLPPTYPQYKKIDYYTYDLAKAKQLVQQSGTKGMKITVWGLNEAPSQPTVEYMASQLTAIGWKATPKLLAHDVYFTTIGNQATKAQIMYTDWYQDYPHPLDWFDVLLNGNRITQTHNNNVGNADFPAANALIEKLKKEPKITPAINAQWASLDHDYVVKYASVAPYLNFEGTDFFGKNVDLGCYYNHVLFQFDWTSICMKK